jgi:hypothetical protein
MRDGQRDISRVVTHGSFRTAMASRSSRRPPSRRLPSRPTHPHLRRHLDLGRPMATARGQHRACSRTDRRRASQRLRQDSISVGPHRRLDTARTRYCHARRNRARSSVTDGNGRTTRLLAELVFITIQDPAEFQYDWDVDKERYIGLLRGFDVHRDVRDLAAFIDVQSIEA